MFEAACHLGCQSSHPDRRQSALLRERGTAGSEAVYGTRALQVLQLSYLTVTGAGVQDFGNYLPKSLLKVDFSSNRELVGSSLMSSMSSLTKLQELSLYACKGIKDLRGLCELTSLLVLSVRDFDICELPSDMRALKHLQVLDVSYCVNLTSLDGISQCATTLRRLYANGCWRLRDLPDDFSCFQKLETLDLGDCRSIYTLPKGYERLAGHSGNGTWILSPEGCFGLIVPLVKILRLPEKSLVKCVDTCNFGGDSMQSWVDGWKHVNSIAYELLRRVFSVEIWGLRDFWTYMLDECEVVDFVIRALCEHDDRDVNGTHILVDVVWAASMVDTDSDFRYPWCFLWMVVMTAPCTLGVAMEEAKLLEPWRSTLLHYTISFILPRENLEKAIVEGILPVCSREGMKVVDIILGAIAAANGELRRWMWHRK